MGAALRWAATETVPDGAGFPATTLAVNVLGCLALALLPALATARRRPTVAAALGPGLLGGFTTMSAYAEQGRHLVDTGHAATAAAYWGLTLLACVAAVALGDRLTTRAQREEWDDEGGDG